LANIIICVIIKPSGKEVQQMRKSYSSREVISIIEADGWYFIGAVGDHHQFKHPTKKGRVTIAHPKKDLEAYEISSIRKQSGLKF
jgi:predicted RNA binding protein YcfA (HicA-like mRNA interferase family)